MQTTVRHESDELKNSSSANLTEDGGGPTEAAMQVEASNHRKLL